MFGRMAEKKGKGSAEEAESGVVEVQLECEWEDDEESEDEEEFDDQNDIQVCAQEDDEFLEKIRDQTKKQIVKKDTNEKLLPAQIKQNMQKEKSVTVEKVEPITSANSQPEKQKPSEKPNIFNKPPTNIFSSNANNIFERPRMQIRTSLQSENIFQNYRNYQNTTTIHPPTNIFSNAKGITHNQYKPSKSSEEMNGFLRQDFQSSLREIAQFILEPKEESKSPSNNTYASFNSNYNRSNATKKEKLYLFSISPSYADLKTYSNEKLNRISDFRIWNKYGEINFMEDISIRDINFEEIIIIPNKIEVLSDALRGKQKQLVFHNYMNYASVCPSDKKFLKKQIVSEMKLKFYKIIYHSEYDGDLVVM